MDDPEKRKELFARMTVIRLAHNQTFANQVKYVRGKGLVKVELEAESKKRKKEELREKK